MGSNRRDEASLSRLETALAIVALLGSSLNIESVYQLFNGSNDE